MKNATDRTKCKTCMSTITYLLSVLRV